MKKLIFALLLNTLLVTTANAQTDYTSRITNPSFEQGTDGWEHKGMGAQGNSVFDIKDGTTYMERWTGRGGAVGSGRLAQELSNLPPGNYELTAAAQNIQEDTPTAAQTGAWIFAGDNTTTVTVRGRYTVAFNFVAGSITIGFDAPAHPPTTGPCSTTSASSSSAAAALPLTSTHPLPQMLNQ